MSPIRLVRPPSGHTLSINKIAGGEIDVKVRNNGLIKYDLYTKKPEKFANISATTKTGERLSPYPYYLDMHRWIAKKLSQLPSSWLRTLNAAPFDDFEPILLDFVNNYGDFFTFDVQSTDQERKIKDWFMEWEAIATASQITHPSDNDINKYLIQYTMPIVYPHKLSFRDKRRSRGGSLALFPSGWIGWCWALIARDKYDNITYKPCANRHGCNRDIPNISPFGKGGRKQKFCSNRCKLADRQKESHRDS